MIRVMFATRSVIGSAIIALTGVLFAACSSRPAAPPAAPVPQPAPPTAPAAPPPTRAVFQEGVASWYGPGFDGRLTASGEVFDADSLTAAHRRLRFGTLVRVVNLDNGNEVLVRINDRGPFVDGRVIDVSQAAARVLGMIRAGIARVQLFIEREARPSEGGRFRF